MEPDDHQTKPSAEVLGHWRQVSVLSQGSFPPEHPKSSTSPRSIRAPACQRRRAVVGGALKRNRSQAATQPRPPNPALLAIRLRHDSTLDVFLANNATFARDVITVAVQGSWTLFAAWLEAHGVHMGNKAISPRRHRPPAADAQIQHRTAMVSELRGETKNRETSIVNAILDHAVTALASTVDAVAGASKNDAPLLLDTIGKLTGLRLMELHETEMRGRRSDRVLKRKEFKWRRESKVKTGLQQIEKETGRNEKVKAAIYAIRNAMEASL